MPWPDLISSSQAITLGHDARACYVFVNIFRQKLTQTIANYEKQYICNHNIGFQICNLIIKMCIELKVY
jgi:hypothetical protein